MKKWKTDLLFQLGLINKKDPDDGAEGGAVETEVPVEETPPSDDASDSQDKLWETLSEEFEAEDNEGLEPEPKAEEEEPPAAEEPAPETLETKPEDEPQEKPEEGQEAEEPASEEEPAEEPPAEEPPQPEPTQEELQQQLVDLEEKLVSHYQLSDEHAELMQTEPEKVIPQLAAKMAMDLQQAFSHQLHTLLPQMVAQTIQRQQAASEGEQSFYSQWPALKDYQETVLRLGQAYRQLNPTASREQFIREVGAQAMLAHKIPFNMETGEMIVEEEIQDTIPAPHTPPTPSAVQPPPRENNNPFAKLAEEFIEEDKF